MTSGRYSSPWALSRESRPTASRSSCVVEGVDAGRDLGDGQLVGGRRPCARRRARPRRRRRGSPGRSRSGRRRRWSAAWPRRRSRVRARRARRSVSAVSSGASPGTTTTVPVASAGSASSASRTACPVPCCSACTHRRRASGAISARCARDLVARGGRRRPRCARRCERRRRRRGRARAASGRRSRAAPSAAPATSSGCPRRRRGRSTASGAGTRRFPLDGGRHCMAGGLGLEPRLHGSKGRRAADYPIPQIAALSLPASVADARSRVGWLRLRKLRWRNRRRSGFLPSDEEAIHDPARRASRRRPKPVFEGTQAARRAVRALHRS